VTLLEVLQLAKERVVLVVVDLGVVEDVVPARELDFRLGTRFDFTVAAAFTARVVAELDDVPLEEGTLLNVNVPAGEPHGVEVTRLGKRIYRDELKLSEEDGARRRYWVYGDAPDFEDEPGTDLAAVAQGRIAVTPLHFDLLDRAGMDALDLHDLARLLQPAAEELEE
jgi:5'-nucleotidase